MSHSKKTKRGFSLFIESWNPRAKRFINTCKVCGTSGYSPTIEDPGFAESPEHRAMYAELTRTMKPLALDGLGRCEDCARVMDKK